MSSSFVAKSLKSNSYRRTSESTVRKPVRRASSTAITARPPWVAPNQTIPDPQKPAARHRRASASTDSPSTSRIYSTVDLFPNAVLSPAMEARLRGRQQVETGNLEVDNSRSQQIQHRLQTEQSSVQSRIHEETRNLLSSSERPRETAHLQSDQQYFLNRTSPQFRVTEILQNEPAEMGPAERNVVDSQDAAKQGVGIGRHRPASSTPLESCRRVPTGVPVATNPTSILPSSKISSSPSVQQIGGFTDPDNKVTLPNSATFSPPVTAISSFPTTASDSEISSSEAASDFLEKRRAAAAHQRNQASGIPGQQHSTGAESSTSAADKRAQVMRSAQKAMDRIAILGKERHRRRKFGQGWVGRLKQWLYLRREKRMNESGKGKRGRLLRLWMTSLIRMEGDYGSSMMLTFSFLRWVFLLNAVLSVLWIGLIILPFWIKPPKTFSWNFLKNKRFGQALQGIGLEHTFLYYGGYTYLRSEQPKWYRTDYMYPVAVGATFLISLVCVLYRISGKIVGSSDLQGSVMYPFSSLVFASWDFHITSLEAAAKIRRGIRMQLRELLGDNMEKTRVKGFRDHLMSAKRFLALFVLWPLVMAGTVAAIVILVTEAETVNAKFGVVPYCETSSSTN